MTQVLYDDGFVKLDTEGLTIRRYYFPFGTSKQISYAQIKGVREWHMRSRNRLWGSSDFSHWWPLDWHRSEKEKALFLDLGSRVIPVITPVDPDRVLALLQEQIAHA